MFQEDRTGIRLKGTIEIPRRNYVGNLVKDLSIMLGVYMFLLLDIAIGFSSSICCLVLKFKYFTTAFDVKTILIL